ncbi:hypothetical protein KQI46_08905 [Lysinibacillus capsici]|uniref:hypothetical protein n=1 Tax=Lysinibacillus capsici TaxID=2115968 RepID=UPI001C11A68E|nr:hypothetical protein [Lysinibacillus capsici]MBU5252057.1 hypothetical protein [Lysinibacillus capsici]
MTKFKVGDKVRILNVNEIEDAVQNGFKTNGIYKVNLIDEEGCPVINNEIHELCFYKHELKYIEKVTNRPSKNQRITALEDTVAKQSEEINELKLIVHELRGKKTIEPSTTNTVEDIIEFEGQQYRKVDREAREGDVVMFTVNNVHYRSKKSYKVIENVKFTDENGQVIHVYNEHKRTPENVDVYELIKGGLNPQIPIVDETIEPLTPNQQRAAIIEKAKKFVDEHKSKYRSEWNIVGHTVQILIYDSNGMLMMFRQAKCNPSDVFNEHIGKAIALGRALGLDVSEFEQAVQPTLAVGQIVYHRGWKDTCEIAVSGHYFMEASKCAIDSTYARESTIINDTNAIYEVIK